MPRHWFPAPAAFLAAALLALAPVNAWNSRPQPFARPLNCAEGECTLLRGAPQTAGMRSGFVRLSPGRTVGWHNTARNEESLVVLSGEGEALIEGRSARTFTAPAFVYIPPATRHNVSNTGKAPLEYIYVVAPAAALPVTSAPAPHP